jgi:chromate reductase
MDSRLRGNDGEKEPPMKLLVFAASHRTDSVNRKLAKLASTHAAAQGVTIDFAEYGEFDMPVYNDIIALDNGVPAIAQTFAHRVAAADGVIVASPEYNWSYPGSLKNIIDWTSRIPEKPVAGKTVLLMSATPGSRGGILGLNHLKSPFEAMHMHVFHKVFPLGNVHDAFDKNGQLADEKQRDNFTAILNAFLTYTKKLS